MIWHRLRLCGSLGAKLTRVFWQLLYGEWRVSSLPRPVVSIFGGARMKESDHYFRQAHQLAQRLIENDISVLTGGGPGVMEAASCGALAKKGKGKSMGISVRDLGEGRNPCVQEYFELDYFFARKWLLTRYSDTFLVFPGGFGTLDELAEVLTLMQTDKLKRVPIVLVGVEYWAPFMTWVNDEALAHGLVSKEDVQLFTITDDLEQAFCVVRDECKL